jgi:hypothetical protein
MKTNINIRERKQKLTIILLLFEMCVGKRHKLMRKKFIFKGFLI